VDAIVEDAIVEDDLVVVAGRGDRRTTTFDIYSVYINKLFLLAHQGLPVSFR
jgi:hypothetical protein